MTVYDLPLGVQTAVDDALDAGRWMTEDQGRLGSFLATADPDRLAESLAEDASAIAVGMALAHVKAADARTVMETIALASRLAVAAIRDAKDREGGLRA